jgi:FMN phosphatase YigB (HAD superfamily)
LGLVLAAVSFAPAPPERPNTVSPVAEARYRAAVKQYDETWAYYRQARIDSYQVYVWSRFVLESRRAIAVNPAEDITALEDHLDRMKKLEELVKKIRRLGFGRSYDVGASEYYRLEAEFWLERAK